MLLCISCLLLSLAKLGAQTTTSPPASPPPQETSKAAPLTPAAISQLRVQADAGDASSQTKLGQAYREGNGVPENDRLALTWFRKAADQGDAAAENNLGIMYRMGNGVERDKEEAVRWYAKAAKHGNSQAMFNLGASYYNGDGVASNEYTAYAWFLLAQDAGDSAGDDAARRSAATMSQRDTAESLMRVAEMYEKGEDLPKNEEQAVRWLRKAAEISPQAKVRLADRLAHAHDAASNYGQVLELCKAAAKDYPPGSYCVGFLYRKGWGVSQDSAEAIKWFQKAAAFSNPNAMLDLADMYLAGEGTKVDRPAAFVMLYRAARVHASGAREKAINLLQQMNKEELKHVDRKLHDQRFDPPKVFAELRTGSSR